MCSAAILDSEVDIIPLAQNAPGYLNMNKSDLDHFLGGPKKCGLPEK